MRRVSGLGKSQGERSTLPCPIPRNVHDEYAENRSTEQKVPGVEERVRNRDGAKEGWQSSLGRGAQTSRDAKLSHSRNISTTSPRF